MTIQLRHKQMHISKLLICEPFLVKSNDYTKIKHTHTNTKQMFEELVTWILPLFKKHTRPEHPSTVNHSIYRYKIHNYYFLNKQTGLKK